MGLHDTQYAEFRARIRRMPIGDIELYVANPLLGRGWFPWYQQVPGTAEEKECVQIARSEIGRRHLKYEDRRYWLTTAIAVVALAVAIYAALKP